MTEIFFKYKLMFLHFCENSSNVSVNANSCYMQFAWALPNHAGDKMHEAVNAIQPQKTIQKQNAW